MINLESLLNYHKYKSIIIIVAKVIMQFLTNFVPKCLKNPMLNIYIYIYIYTF